MDNSKIQKLLAHTPQVANVGSETFFEGVSRHSPESVHVLWVPKAGGNDELAAIADFLLHGEEGL